MDVVSQPRRIVRFGNVEVDLASGELRKQGLKISLQDQPFQVLALLLQRPGEVVGREELRQALWPEDTFVDFEHGLNTAIKKLRRALGDSAEHPRYIATHYKRGYRFVAPVEITSAEKYPMGLGQGPPETTATERRARPGKIPRAGQRFLLFVIAVMALSLATWLGRRSRPPLAERDSVVVAEFQNKTGEEVFDGALRQALLSQMAQSPYLSTVSEDRIQSTLGLMGRTPTEPLTEAIAREICQRVGGKAVLAGSIWILGGRYFVQLDATGCATGERLANEYGEAASREQILPVLSQASSGMRGKLGESLASIRRLSVPAEVTTSSLEALKAYSAALVEQAMGHNSATLLRSAIEFDPRFAAAYLRLAEVHNIRGEELEAEDAISKAFALRANTSERERLEIESTYHRIASGNLDRAIAAGTLATRLYPGDAVARRSLFVAQALAGEPAKALQMAQREVKLAPEEAASYYHLAHFLFLFGREAEALDVLDAARRRGLRTDLFPVTRCMIAALDGNFAAMREEATRAIGKMYEHRLSMLHVQAASRYGRLDEARAVSQSASMRNLSSAPAIAASLALAEAVFGLRREARHRANEALALNRGRRTAATAALALALSDESDAARSILGELLDRYPDDTLLKSVWSPAVRGAIALAEGEPRQAVDIANAPPHTARFAWPAYICGLGYLKLGLVSQALVEFQKIIDRKSFLIGSTYVYGAAFADPVAQLGLARGLEMDGRIEESRKAYEKFLSAWKNAGSDIPVLIQAKREYSGLPSLDARGATIP